MPSPYCYEYPRPAVTVDIIVFGLEGESLRGLFIRRKHDPFASSWAIPGGFLEMDETIENAARRELKEETGLVSPDQIEPIGVFGDPNRDPRGRTISIAHAAVLSGPLPAVEGSDDAENAAWLETSSIEHLAFDHQNILNHALAWLRRGVDEGSLGLALMPDRFGIEDVRCMLSAVTGLRRGAAPWISKQSKLKRITAGLSPSTYRKVDGPRTITP